MFCTALWQQLMVTNADGYVATVDEDNLLCGCTKTAAVFSDDWKYKVIADTGDHYKLPTDCSGYIDPVRVQYSPHYINIIYFTISIVAYSRMVTATRYTVGKTRPRRLHMLRKLYQK